jgi:hypothetical protein
VHLNCLLLLARNQSSRWAPTSPTTPILTLDGLDSIDAGGDDTDETQANEALTDEQRAQQAAATPRTEQEETDRALNNEDAEYTATDEAVGEAARRDAPVQAEEQEVRNVAVVDDDSAPTAEFMHKISTEADADGERPAAGALEQRSLMTNAARAALVVALKIKPKVAKTASTSTLVGLLINACPTQDPSLLVWYEWAKANME